MTTEIDISDAVLAAKGPLTVLGGGTRGFATVGDSLDVSAHQGITLHEPGALTLVAKAGTPLTDIGEALAAHNQRLAFEPYDLTGLLGTKGASTIGGVIATNASGPRRIQAGAARDFALGVRFVDGQGQVIKNGGRVMKNVTGYDLVKLMCGARGTLGVLTEISLKVLPDVDATQTLIFENQTAALAVEIMSQSLAAPFEVSGAAWIGGDVWLRLEGFSESVAYRTAALSKHLARFGATRMDPEADWTTVRDAAPLHDMDAVWRISVKPSDGPDVVAALPAGCHALMDWAGGLVWVGQSGEDLIATHERLQGQVATLGGHVSLYKGPAAMMGAVSRFQPEPAPVAALTSALRARFDPRGILNPGLMGA